MSNKYGNVSAYYNGNAYFDRGSDKYSLKYCSCSQKRKINGSGETELKYNKLIISVHAYF